MNTASFCIKHKVTTILTFILISIFGIVFYTNLKLTLMPAMEYPAAYISCYYNGAGPEDIEELVTRPLESAVATLSGVKDISSSSSENVCTVMVNYEDGTDVNEAATRLREKFNALSLPDGCTDPVIFNMNVDEMMPVVALALIGENLSDLQTSAEKVVSPALERIPGVASVMIQGGVDSQVVVEVNSARLAGYNMSIPYVSNYLAASNALFPGGQVKNGSQKLTVSTNGQYKTVDDIANTLIPLPAGGGAVRLSELARVYIEEDTKEGIAKVGDQKCVILSVSKQSGSNEVETADAVREAMETLKADNPSIDYFVAMDSSEYIRMTTDNAIQNIILGIVLSAIVVFLFLRRFGATFTIAVSMPFCIVTVFLLMNAFHITMNMMSLGGIAMGVGMIVDNSIVVLENIYRYAGDGYSRYDSCVLGTKEIALPVTASTLTTVAVFLPIGLSGGMAGMMFKDFSLTIGFLMMASLGIALTLVPLLCYFLLDEAKIRKQALKAAGKKSKAGAGVSKVKQLYLNILRFFIRRRFVAVLVSIGLVAIFTLSCFSTKTVFMPEMDQGQVMIDIKAPIGTELEQTTAISDRVTGIVRENCPELEKMYYQASPESATIVLNLVDMSKRDRSTDEVAVSLRPYVQDIAGCEITVSAYSMMSMASGDNISVTISGDDYDVLTRISAELKEKIAALPDAVDVVTSVEKATPSVSVRVNRENAAQYGLTAATIGTAVRAELTGTTATGMTLDGNDIDIMVRGSDTSAQSLDALRSMPLSSSTGGYVPLSAVADVNVSLTPQTITRKDQSRQVTITGDTISGSPTEVAGQIDGILAEYEFPEGYRPDMGGAYSDMMKSFRDLLLALVVALGLVYFILASQFESFIMPLIVMMILPIAFTGALFGLPVTQNDMSIVALVGLIMLAGVVVNASIILVDYINVRRAAGETKEEAILHACPLRIRPIMMTTLTTVLALIPMALGLSEGSEIMQPMGIVMISGMTISTIITLVFTPVYYSLLDSLSTHSRGLFRRKKKIKQKAK
ncbi:MAG: efflux RND transporter permease subunit [Evtepia sp.]